LKFLQQKKKGREDKINKKYFNNNQFYKKKYSRYDISDVSYSTETDNYIAIIFGIF